MSNATIHVQLMQILRLHPDYTDTQVVEAALKRGIPLFDIKHLLPEARRDLAAGTHEGPVIG